MFVIALIGYASYHPLRSWISTRQELSSRRAEVAQLAAQKRALQDRLTASGSLDSLAATINAQAHRRSVGRERLMAFLPSRSSPRVKLTPTEGAKGCGRLTVVKHRARGVARQPFLVTRGGPKRGDGRVVGWLGSRFVTPYAAT